MMPADAKSITQELNKICEAWAVAEGRVGSNLAQYGGPSTDYLRHLEIYATVQRTLMRAAVGMGEETKLCDACGGEYERTSFSKKQWQATGQRRCGDCVSQGRPARFTDAYRPRVPGHSQLDFMLGQGKLIERAIRVAAQETGMEGTEMEQVIEEMTQLARQQKERFIRQMRLYYYKQVLLEDITSAGVPDMERLIMRRAIYFLTEDLFTGIASKVRRAMSKGKAKLRKVCKEVFLSVDRNVTITHPKDDEEAPEASRSTEEPEPPRDNREAEDEFVPSIERLVDDLVPMLRPEHRDHIDRFLRKASNGTPLTSEQRNHPDWIKLARRFFDFYVGSKKDDGIDVGIFNRCVERQRDEFRQQRYKPTDPGLPLRRRCDMCYVDNALAEWRYPYCTSCNVYWLSPNFRRMDTVDTHCPICLLWPTPGEFSYTLRCGHTLHLKCLEYAKSVKAECPGEKILSVCPVCSDPITDDLEKVVFVQDVWPEHMWWWPDKPPGFIEAADNGLRAAEGAYLAASAAVRASFAALNRASARSLTPAQEQQLNELWEAMKRGDVVFE